MSIKNIALDSRVYRRLATFKRESESFSKAIDRILDEVADSNSGRDILSRLADLPALPEEEADEMLLAIDEARRCEIWERHDLG